MKSIDIDQLKLNFWFIFTCSC